MDFRYDTSRPSTRMGHGLKLYRTTALPERFFLIPGHAILAAFLYYLDEGTIGTDRKDVPAQFNRLTALPPIKGGLIPTRRYINPNAILLQEFILTPKTDSIVFNISPTPKPSGRASVEEVNRTAFIPTPIIVTTAEGKLDAAQSMANFENAVLKQAPFKTNFPPTFTFDSFDMNPSIQPSILTQSQSFGINWEAVALSYVGLIALGKDPVGIRDDMSKYSGSMVLPYSSTPGPSVITSGTAITSTDTVPITTGPSKPSRGCDIVSGKAPMAQFICGQLTAGPQWQAIVQGQVKCTQKGFAIADSLIKVAATRIFAIPEQSIMEPIVNSLDAYNPARRVGKFGMGFFSLMYWVMRDAKAKLRVISVYRHAGNPTPCAYGAEITNLNGQLQVEVQEANAASPNTPNQFFVEVQFGKPIDSATTRKFIEQLNRLRYISSAIINVSGTVVNSQILSTLSPAVAQRLPRVNVTLTADEFSVKDEASGVPIDLFYSSLIVPSISSKTISLSTRKDTGFVGNSRIENKPPRQPDSNYSSFRVLVGDIVIMDLKPEELFNASTAHILTLPLNTRVPVSRDDVILGSVLPETEENLDQLLVSGISRMGDGKDVGMLENGLKAFINETASSQNVAILNQFLTSIPQKLKARNLVAVPAISFYLNLMRLQSPASQAFVTSSNIDLKRLEDYLAANYQTDDTAFTNRKVIVIEGNPAMKYDPAEAGGTTSYIFVDSTWMRQHQKDWASKLASEYKRVMLYPTGTPFAATLSTSLQAVLSRFNSDRVRAAANAMAGQYQLALNFRDPSPGDTELYLKEYVPALLLFLKVYYEPFMNEARFEQFINLIGAAVAKSEPKVAVYGESSTIKAISYRLSNLNPAFLDRGPRDRANQLARTQSFLTPMLTFSPVHSRAFVSQLLRNYSNKSSDPGFRHPQSMELDTLVATHRELFDKATFYMIEIYGYSVDLAGRFSTLNGQRSIPFTATEAFNIPFDLALALASRQNAKGFDLYLFQLSISLLEESQRAYQFLLASVLLYTVMRKLKEDGKISAQQPHPDAMIVEIMNSTKPSELALVILSAIDNEFGSSPQHRIGSALLYIYMQLGLAETIIDTFQFQHLFHDLYKPALDVYGWMEKRLKVSSLVQEVDQGIPSTVPNCYSFTLSQMVSYVFQEELPPTIIQLFDRISKHQSRIESRLQIISIASNEGAVKDPIPGKLTETVQNALDVIRTANHPTVTIPNAQIGILVKKVRGTNDLLLGISDPVGIPLAGIVALSVPFLSSKTSSAIVTGEIGSGFFNVYRDAIGVFIMTTVNGETTEMLDTPVLDPNNNRIIDIQRCARVIRTGAPNGTAIFIQSRHTSETFIPAAIEAVTFARDTLGLISEAGLVTLNKEPISIPLTKIYENDYFEFHMSTKSFGSYIMTKGVPFAPLYKYFTAMGFFKDFSWLLDKFRMGVRLNVKSGVFTPVQTRTKIGLSDENTNILIISMLKAMPFTILFRMENKLIPEKEFDDYIQYFSSTSDAGQVLPGSSGSSAWATNLQKLTSNLQIREQQRNDIIIELSRVAHPFMAAAFSENNLTVNPERVTGPQKHVVDVLSSTLFGLDLRDLNKIITSASGISTSHNEVANLTNLLQEGVKGWPDIGKIGRILGIKLSEMRMDLDTFPGKTIYGLAYRWLLNKKKSAREKKPAKIGSDGRPVSEEEEESPKTTVKSPKHLPFCQVWVNTYCRVARKIIAGYPDKLPVVIFDLTILSNINGSYNHALGILTLAYNYMESPSVGGYELDDIIQVFSGMENPAAQVLQLDIKNTVWRGFFMPKGTIAHELEHFRSGGEHSKGAHDSVHMNLLYGGSKKRVFLVQHHDLMMSLVQAGFYEEVRKAWLQFLATGKI